MTQPTQHGGPRTPGLGKSLGRPRIYNEPMVRRSINMPEWMWDVCAERAVDGTYGAGVREVVKDWKRLTTT